MNGDILDTLFNDWTILRIDLKEANSCYTLLLSNLDAFELFECVESVDDAAINDEATVTLTNSLSEDGVLQI